MLFAHDTEMALAAAAALVNTAHGGESLTGPPALDAFVTRWQWTGDRARDEEELVAVRSLRPRLEQLWHRDEDGVVELVNELLREAGALPQLVRHDGWSYHLHAVPPEAPLAVRMSVEAAMAFTDLVRAGELARLGICSAPDCDDVLVDLSKNRSRRFCDTGCANRVNVAAYRARRSAG
jgi:predicted RNA-binding Zn ribbon-like protein